MSTPRRARSGEVSGFGFLAMPPGRIVRGIKFGNQILFECRSLERMPFGHRNRHEESRPPGPVRLEPVRAPYSRHRCRTDTGRLGHRPGTSMGGAFWRGLRGQFNDLLVIHMAFAPTARQILLDRRQSALGVATTPATDLNRPHTQLCSDGMIVHAVGGQQYDPRPSREPHTRGVRAYQSFKPLLLGRVQNDIGCNALWVSTDIGLNCYDRRYSV